MATYTYTIFDSDPNSSSATAWPSHEDLAIDADSDEEAVEAVREVMSIESSSLSTSDGYEVGQLVHAIVWSEDGHVIVGQPTYALTASDLGVDKSDVKSWETVATFVSTFPDGDEEGACDVEVQIGEASGGVVRADDGRRRRR